LRLEGGVLSGFEWRYATPRDPERRTLGYAPCRIMAGLGAPPMPWQEYVLNVSYEVDEERAETGELPPGCVRAPAGPLDEFLDGRGPEDPPVFLPLFYREPRGTIPRQAGKTTKALARHVDRHRNGRARGWGRRPNTLYLAQTARASADKLLEEWVPMLEEWAGYEEAVKQVVRSNGRESVLWKPPGGRLLTVSPSKTAGHGITAVDLVDIDEAFAHVDARAEQGVRPTMITRVSPQIWVVSTAGDASSAYFWGKVDDARAREESGNRGRVCYFEASAEKDADIRDPEVLRGCHPALGHTITLEALLADIDSMELDEARRAYGNIWTTSVSRIIPEAAWAACEDLESTIVGPVRLAADASPNMTDPMGVVTASGRNVVGNVHSEVLAHRPGIGWIPRYLEETQQRNRDVLSVRVDPVGPLRAVLPDIQNLSYVPVFVTDERLAASSAGRFLADVMEAHVAHLGQPSLNDAVDGAAKRQLGDSWAWTRRHSSADVCPLVSASQGHWDVVTNPENG
jgi:hypothetical protein